MPFDTPVWAVSFTPQVTFTLQYDFPVGGVAGRDPAGAGPARP